MLQIHQYSQIVAVGDVHGDLPRLVALLQAIDIVRVIDERVVWIAPRGTVLVQMGDQVDSAPRGDSDIHWETACDLRVVEFMSSLEHLAHLNGSTVVNLLGNHELMNIYGDMTYVSDKSLRFCGGYESRKRLMSPGSTYVRRHLANRHIACIVGGILFCHAGLLPEHVRSLGQMQRETHRWLETGETMSTPIAEKVLGTDGIVWTRRYTEAGADALADIVHERLGTTCMVVGHTVVPEIKTSPRKKVMFIDTGFSRSLGGNHPEVLLVGADGHMARVKVKIDLRR